MPTPDTKTILQKPQPNRFFLKLTGGPQAGKIYNLIGETIRIGRGPMNDIVIEDPNLSRTHALFILRDSHCTVKDLNSRNGVYVNSKKISECEVRHQDFIQMGDSEALLIEIEKDLELHPPKHSPEHPKASEPSPLIHLTDSLASSGVAIHLAPKAGSLLERLLGIDPKTRNRRLAAATILFGFLLLFLFSRTRTPETTPPLRTTASSSPLRMSPAARSSTDPSNAPPTAPFKRLDLKDTPAKVYAQCLDLEDLEHLRRAAECYLSIPDYPGARDGYKRVTEAQEDLSKRLYLEGQELYEIGYYERAREMWTRVREVAREDSEYYRLATKGLSNLKKMVTHDPTYH